MQIKILMLCAFFSCASFILEGSHIGELVPIKQYTFKPNEQGSRSLVITPDCSRVETVLNYSGNLVFDSWDLSDGKQHYEEVQNVESVHAIDSAGNYRVVASGSQAILFDRINNTFKKLYHLDSLSHLRFNKAGTLLATVSQKIVKIWDVLQILADTTKTVEHKSEIECLDQICSVEFASDNTIMIGTQKSVSFWSCEKGEAQRILVKGLKFFPSASAIAFDSFGIYCAIRFEKSSDIEVLNFISGKKIAGISGKKIAGCTLDKEYECMDVMQFDPSGNSLALSMSKSNGMFSKKSFTIAVLDCKSNQLTFLPPRHTSKIQSIRFSENNQIITASEDGVVVRWGEKALVPVQQPPHHDVAQESNPTTSPPMPAAYDFIRAGWFSPRKLFFYGGAAALVGASYFYREAFCSVIGRISRSFNKFTGRSS
jgi:WD40 repeat protein